MKMLIGKQTKNLWRFFGSTNVDYAYINGSEVVSRAIRKNPMYYFLNVTISIMILIFSSLFIAFLFGKATLFTIFILFILLCTILFLYFLLRLKEGDTIIVTEDGIKELDWLFSRYLKWDDVVKIYFYPESEFSKKFPILKIFNITWTNIKIKGRNKTIRISTKFSNNEQLQEYIQSKCKGKIEEHKYEPLYTLIMMIAAIVIALCLYVFRPFRGLAE